MIRYRERERETEGAREKGADIPTSRAIRQAQLALQLRFLARWREKVFSSRGREPERAVETRNCRFSRANRNISSTPRLHGLCTCDKDNGLEKTVVDIQLTTLTTHEVRLRSASRAGSFLLIPQQAKGDILLERIPLGV